MASNGPLPERAFSLEGARDQIATILASENLTTEYECCDGSRRVSHVLMADSSGFVVEGSGKGVAHQIGAVAEALEHRAFELEGLGRSDSTTSSHALARQIALEGDAIIGSLLELPEVDIAYAPFRSKDGNEVLLPLALVNPYYAERPSQASEFLRRYATNSGSAFGLTRLEAAVHGYNEVVERHYLSMLFRGLVLGHRTVGFESVEVLNPTAPTPDAGSILIVKACFIHDIHFALARPAAKNASMLVPIGSGASRDPDIALERAVSELVQCMALSDRDLFEHDRKVAAFLGSSPRLRRLLAPTPDPIGTVTSNPAYFALPTQDQALMREVARYHGDAGVWQTYVPGADRFNLIRQGNLVAPQDQLRCFA